MQTISAEEYKRRYGTESVKAFDTNQRKMEQSYSQRVIDKTSTDLANRATRFGDIMNRQDTGVVTKGVQAFGQGAGLAANTLENVVTEIPGVKQVTGAIGSGINWLATSKYSPVKYVGGVLGNSKTLQEAIRLYDTDQNFKDSIDSVANIVRLGGDVSAAVESANYATNVTKKLVDKVKVSSIRNDASSVVNSHLKVADMELKDPDIGPQLKTPDGTAQLLERTKINIVDGLRGDNFGTVADKIAKIDTSTLSSLDDFKAAIKEVAGKKTSLFSAEPTAQVRLAAAIKDSTPNYELLSKAERAKVLGQVKEGGVIQGRTVTPSKMQIEAGTEVSKIPNYNPSSTKLEKFNVVKAEVEKQAEALKTSLKNENVITPKKEYSSRVKAKLKEIPNESLLLQKSDPVIKNYLRVYNNTIKQVDGNLSGVLELRKMLDDTYENARGKNAFGSDKAAALDDVHTAVRNTLTEYLIEKASTDVKGALRSQWNLYRALDELRTAATNESGSRFGRLKQKYPITNKIIEGGVRGAGLGAGLNIIQ